MTSSSVHDTVAPTIPALMAAFESGRAEALEQGALRYLAQAPDDGLVRSLLAASLQMQGRVAEAAEVHAELTRRQPGEAAHWNNLGNALRELHRPDEAQAAYRRALALDPGDALIHHNLGLLSLEKGDYSTARTYLLDAHDRDPDAVLLRIHAAKACHECGDFQNEQRLIAPWAQWPSLPHDEALELTGLLAQNGHAEEACRMLREAAAGMPQPAHAWARLVLILERVNRLDEARQALAQLPEASALEDAGLRQDVLNAHAVMAVRDGDWETAYRLFAELLAAPGDKRMRSSLYFAHARVCDRLKRFDEAMQACAEAHAAQVESIGALVPELLVPGSPPLPVALSRWPRARYAAAKPVSGPGAAASPVFVVGFPRSGTTLLEQMLDAHPALCSMDEQPFLQQLVDGLERRGLAWPDDLGELDEAACESLRQDYWRRVREVATPAPGQRLVDKNPLNLLRLPLIHRLFPESKVILALRHPCDVLLSCYMQSFRSPAFAVLCSSLERLARGYADAMDGVLYHAGLLGNAMIELRYEDLVDAPAVQVQRLGAFLELDEPERLLGFQQHARAKGYISTPSYSQVVEGINRRGLDRWHPYRAYFEPVLPLLQPYLDRWDYRG